MCGTVVSVGGTREAGMHHFNTGAVGRVYRNIGCSILPDTVDVVSSSHRTRRPSWYGPKHVCTKLC